MNLARVVNVFAVALGMLQCWNRADRVHAALEEHDSGAIFRRIRVYDDTGNVIETQEHTGDFKEW